MNCMERCWKGHLERGSLIDCPWGEGCEAHGHLVIWEMPGASMIDGRLSDYDEFGPSPLALSV